MQVAQCPDSKHGAIMAYAPRGRPVRALRQPAARRSRDSSAAAGTIDIDASLDLMPLCVWRPDVCKCPGEGTMIGMSGALRRRVCLRHCRELCVSADRLSDQRARERMIGAALNECAVTVDVRSDTTVHELGTLCFQTGRPYSVFTQYARDWASLPVDQPLPPPARIWTLRFEAGLAVGFLYSACR